MNNAIIELLNLKEEDIESLSCHRLGEDLCIELSLKRKQYICPKCSQLTHKVLNQYTRVINHGIFIGKKCIVHYRQKRYKCPLCEHTFNEPYHLVAKYQKKSLSTYIQIMELLKDPHITFRKAADLLTISDKTVMDTFYKNLPEYQPVLPRVLCIDEVYLGRNSIKKYVAVLLNFETNDVVDIIYGRTKDSLHSFFQKFPKEALDSVEYVSSDMFEGYRTMKGTYFTQARLCIDSFHVIKLINEMFNKQLRTIMKGFD